MSCTSPRSSRRCSVGMILRTRAACTSCAASVCAAWPSRALPASGGAVDTQQLALDRHAGQPLYRQLADALAARIADITLPPGMRLPAERELAAQLGVSRTTAVSAYHELEARGLVRGHVGRGTYVCAAPD